MICEKCGTEFSEGRNCPNCGALAIFVKEEEYKNRKQEWEEENAPKEDAPVKKFKLNIHINPVIVKKVVLALAVVCIIATAIVWIKGVVSSVVKNSRYEIVYDNNTVMNSDSGSFSVYSVDNTIYSVNGHFAYENRFNTDSISGEVIAANASDDGNFYAYVYMEATGDVKYSLYVVKKSEGSAIMVRSGNEQINIVGIASTGSVYYETAAIGAYEVVLDTALYRYSEGKSVEIAKGIASFVAGENDDEFIYYDSTMQAYIYCDGKTEQLLPGTYGYEYVMTSEGEGYYISAEGYLYHDGEKASADWQVTHKSLNAVGNSDKITYVKDGSLYCYGGSFKNPVKLVDEYDIYGEKCNVVSKGSDIYYAYNGKYYMCTKSGKIKELNDGVKAVYLYMK